MHFSDSFKPAEGGKCWFWILCLFIWNIICVNSSVFPRMTFVFPFNWIVLSVSRVYKLTSNLENLCPPGAKWISQIWKNFFGKTYFYGLCGTPLNNLGPKTHKCIFWRSLVFIYSKLTQKKEECSVTEFWTIPDPIARDWLYSHLRVIRVMCLTLTKTMAESRDNAGPGLTVLTYWRRVSRQGRAGPALMSPMSLMTHTCANHWPGASIITQPECQQNV